MGRTCSTHERGRQRFWWESQKEKPLERPGRRWEDNIKKYTRIIGLCVMGRIRLPQDMDEWRALVNMVLNPWVHKISGNP
jgi:hypothetical protein